MVPTGVAIALPDGYAAFVHPRSGLAARFGVGIVNAPGTVDAGYRGEIKVLLVNHDTATPVRLSRGDRIAQLIVQRVEQVHFQPVDALPGSARGAGGHGSTGGFTDTRLPPPPEPTHEREHHVSMFRRRGRDAEALEPDTDAEKTDLPGNRRRGVRRRESTAPR